MRFISKLLTLIFLTTMIFVFSSCKKEHTRSFYNLSVEYKDGKIDGKLSYKFVNCYSVTFDHLVFNLHANAYSQDSIHRPTTNTTQARAYPNGLDYGKISIIDVRKNGSTIKYQTYGDDGEFLKIYTGEIKKGDCAEIEIDFVTEIPNSTLRLGETDLGVNLADFFPVVCKIEDGKFMEISYSPVGDPYFADLHDYEVDLTVPSEYSVASSGYPTLTTVDGVTTTYSYELKNGRDFAFSLSKNYQIHSKTIDGKTFNYYGFSSDGDKMLDFMIDCVDFFSQSFGDYPYDSLSVAECQFALGGMEYSGLCFINYNLTEEDKPLVLAHEIAHEWWHSAVGNNQNTNGYIDEGLCEYSTYLYLLSRGEENLAINMINSAKSAYRSFFSLEETLSGNANTAMERELSSFKSEYEYANLAYNKSLLMFYEYGKAIGEDKALKNLKELYKTNLWGVISLDKLTDSLGLSEHFNSFVFGKVLV